MAWADPRPVTLVESPSGSLNINLDEAFEQTETHHHVVTKDINYESLKLALKWVVGKVETMAKAPPGDDARVGKLEEQLTELVGENTALKDKLKALEQQQEGLAQQLDVAKARDQGQHRSEPQGENTLLASRLLQLEERLAKVEARRSVPGALTIVGGAEGMAPGQANAAMLDRIAELEALTEKLAASIHEAQVTASRATADASDAVSAARRVAVRQEAERKEHEEAEAAKPAPPPGVGHEDLHGLRSALEAQLAAQAEEVQTQMKALRGRLEDKADRSELDSLMQSGATPSQPGGEGEGAEGEAAEPYVAAAPAGEPFDAEAMIDAINRAGAELRAVRNRMTVLQERLKKKADQSTIDDLRQQLLDAMAKVRKEVKDTRGEVLDIKGRTRAIEGLEAAMDDLAKRLNAAEREQRRLAMEREMDKQEREQQQESGPAQVMFVRTAPSTPPGASDADRAEHHDNQIEELYKLMSNKANATDVAALIVHIRQITAQIEELRAASAGGAGGGLGSVPASPRVAKIMAADPDSPRGWAASTGGDTRLERLEAAVTALQHAVSFKADGDALDAKADRDQVVSLVNKLAGLALDVANKADRSAIDELRLRMTLMSQSEEPRGGAAPSNSGPDGVALVAMLQEMMGRKAGQDELDALKALVQGKAGRAELDALAGRVAAIPPPAAPVVIERPASVSGGPGYASRDELSTLATQIGDLYAELERQRRELARVPKEASLMAMLSEQPLTSPSKAHAAATVHHHHAAPAQHPDTMKLINALAKDLQEMKEQADMVAHAVCVLSIGVDRNNPDTAQPRGGYDRLVKLLGAKAVHHKMDYFDPDVLNRMAHKVSNLDAVLLKNPNMIRVGPDLGLKELESQMRKMARELRNLKDRLAETAAAAGLPAIPTGDHAMLAGKPLQGYRCLACDRPLEKLDTVPGPFMPTNQLTAKLQQTAPEKLTAPMRQSKAGLTPEPSAAKKIPYDNSQRGPQQWYEGDAAGKPAEQLPKDDVGPKLAPGGWTRRTSASGGVRVSNTGRSTSGLPDIGGPWSPSRDGTRELADGGGSTTTLPAI